MSHQTSFEMYHYCVILVDIFRPQTGNVFPDAFIIEPRHVKTGFLYIRKQTGRSADQRLFFRYTDSTIPVLYESEILSI